MKQIVKIRSRIDDITLDIFLNDNNSLNNFVLFIHGFNSNKESYSYKYIGDKLLDNNISYAIFSLPYHGERRSLAEDFTVKNCLEDIDLVIDYLYKNIPLKSLTILGTSFGGYLTLLKIKQNKLKKENVILKSPAIKMGKVFESFIPENEKENFKEKGFIIVPNDKTMKIYYSFLEELKNNRAEDMINLNKEMTIIHGKLDDTVPYTDSVEFAKNNLSINLILLDNEKHNYSDDGLDKVVDVLFDIEKNKNLNL